MITPKYSDALAQVGFWVCSCNPSLGTYYFYEGGASDAGSPVTWHTGVPAGSTHRFWVQWASVGCGTNSGCFAYNIDTTRIAISYFNPYSYWGHPNTSSNPWDIQLHSETHNLGSDVPGRPTGGIATVWSEPQGQDYNTDNYGNYVCNLSSVSVSGTRYGLNYPSNKGCGTWSTYTN